MARCIAILLGVLYTCESVTLQQRTRMNMSLSSMLSSKAMSAVKLFAEKITEPGAEVNTHGLLKNVEQNLDFGTAQKMVLQQNLPSDVVTLVQNGHGAGMDEVSLAKARKALNRMYESAWKNLDKELGVCKGFQERFEENDGAVSRDINRLVERINDLVRVESESTLGIENIRKDKETTKATKRREVQAYNLQLAQDKSDLTIYKNDLEVFAFIVGYTGDECQKAPSTTFTQICSAKKGPNKGKKYLSFADKKVQQNYEKILTPSARMKIQDILQEVENVGEESASKKAPVSFLQRGDPPAPTPPPPPIEPFMAATTTAPPPGKKSAVVGWPHPVTEYVVGGGDCGEGCIGGPGEEGDCGDILTMCPIHDKLSLLWGTHKDKVDELTMDMMHRAWDFSEMKRNIASQLRILDASESKLVALLSETKSNLAADRSEIRTKYALKRRLTKQYERKTKELKKSICWIACQDMAAVKIVRNAVLVKSTVCPSDKIVDCVVDDWVPEMCSKTCDDSCSEYDPFKCGGWQQMTREIIVDVDQDASNKCGIKCPKLTQSRRCGQVKCPVDCVMSAWSGFAECSAECGGGVKKKTRSMMTDAQNGGAGCPIAESIENCNDQGCPTDCVLQDWTSWSGCSVACGGGISTRRKHVLIPIKGDGKCPKPDALGERLEEKNCNEHQCAGDEICIAKQDLIVALDSSASIALHQDGDGLGFNILKKFSKKLLSKYEKKYYGTSKMQIGLIQFGNGKIVQGRGAGQSGAGPKGVSPAIIIQEMTDKLDLVRNAICAKDDDELCSEDKSTVKYKKGFTNLAQAFVLAERLFSLNPTRNSASHAVMVITDGIASFKYQTTEMAHQLQDKGILRYFIAVTKNGIKSNVMEDVKSWASDPWDTNVLHITGGLEELTADPDYFASEAIVKFCPQAYSPSVGDWERNTYGYEEVIENGFCGSVDTRRYLGHYVYDVEDCAGRARNGGFQTFLVGNYHMRGKCIGGTLDGNLTLAWDDWHKEIEYPKCPPLDKTGDTMVSTEKYIPGSEKLTDPDWHMFFNFYALMPHGMGTNYS